MEVKGITWARRKGDLCQGWLSACSDTWSSFEGQLRISSTWDSAAGRDEGTKAETSVRGWSAVLLGHEEGKKWDRGRWPGHQESKGQPCEINEHARTPSQFRRPGFFLLWQERVWSKACSWHSALLCGFIGGNWIESFFFSNIILAAVGVSPKAKFILFH